MTGRFCFQSSWEIRRQKLIFDSMQKGGALLAVVCGLISNKQGEILIARKKVGKSLAGMWEFPGGKIEAESPEEALIRELREELGMEIGTPTYFTEVTHAYPTITICLKAYTAAHLSGPTHLTDHDLWQWLPVDQLMLLPLAPADVPIAQQFIERLKDF